MIKQKDKPCKCGCGRVGKLFSHGLLRDCWMRSAPRKALVRKPIKKISEKKKVQRELEKIETKKFHEWFLKVWDKTEDAKGYCYCYETHTPMHRSLYRNNTCCYHHPLEKSKYPQFAMQEWNILIVLPDVHSQTHSNSDKTPRIKNYTTELLEKI